MFYDDVESTILNKAGQFRTKSKNYDDVFSKNC